MPRNRLILIAGACLALTACMDETAQQLPGDALVAGTPYHATGTIPCSGNGGLQLRECPFGVVRYGGGNATVVVTMPNGGEREIRFEGGRPVSSNSPAGIVGEHKNGVVFVNIGTTETYQVFDEIMFGG